jgi:SAM-dependent methyltransferase
MAPPPTPEFIHDLWVQIDHWQSRAGNSRHAMACRFLKGSGIEIGGLHGPIRVPTIDRVANVDRMTIEGLRQHYPELAGTELTPVDIVDDGETLATIPAESQDFVIASHVIEHCENPLLAIRNWLRVAKIGSCIMIVVPDKRFTFDSERPVTPWHHVLRDYTDGPDWSRWSHYEEVVRSQAKWAPLSDDQTAWARKLMNERHSIHFHVWEPQDFLEVLVMAKRIGLTFEVAQFSPREEEFIAILRRT